MRATRTFTDGAGVTRKNGEEWLIKMEDTETHIPDVYEEVRKSNALAQETSTHSQISGSRSGAM